MTIAILRFSAMGDVILASVCVRYLRQRFGDAEIFFITSGKYAGLFRDDPALSGVLAVDPHAPTSCGQEIKTRHWDLVIDLQHNVKSRRLLRHMKYADCRRFEKKHAKRLLLLLFRINLYARQRDSVVYRYLSAAGMSADTDPALYAPRIIINETRTLASLDEMKTDTKHPWLALLPFSGWKNKKWPEKYFEDVARHFADRQWKIAIFGGDEDVYNAWRIKKNIGRECTLFAGRLSLYECAAGIGKCDLALGNDTGLSHLARARGVKTGIVYGATTWHWGFFPFGEPAFRVFQASMPCRPCHPHGGDLCLRFNRPCMHRVRPSEVIKELERLYEE